MGVAKKTRKFAQVKRTLGKRDNRHAAAKAAADPNNPANKKKKAADDKDTKLVQTAPSHMYFQHNDALVPPYNVLCDTNFFVHTVRNKLDLEGGLMDAMLAKCNIIVTDCVMAELELLDARKAKLPLMIARDERWKRLMCGHKGHYADDCLTDLVQKDRIYCIGTNDAPLRRQLRKIPGVPLIAAGRGKYSVERLPNATF